ncbi:MAG: hypothetical protein GXO47_04810 [Chlorobi bacterium]|nr:hypothetical protein [Chlorobiota bacterium]
MKAKVLVAALFLLFTTSVFNNCFAQAKVVTVIRNNDSINVFVDSLGSSVANPFALFFDDKDNDFGFDLDSMFMSAPSGLDSMMQIMTIMMDSVQNKLKTFTFNMPDQDLLMNMFPPDSVINNMMNIDMNMKVVTDTLPNGQVIQSVTIMQTGKGPVVTAGTGNTNITLNNEDIADEILSPVPLSDIHVLKKAGYSISSLTGEPLEFIKEDINVNKIVNDGKDLVEIEIEARLPEKGKVEIALIDKNGKKVQEQTNKNSDKVNVKYKLDDSLAPYYIVISQNKKIWSRKVAI